MEILLLPVFKPSLKFFRDPIVGVRLVLKASDLFEAPVGPGGRNAQSSPSARLICKIGMAVMAGLLKCKQLVIASLGRINGHKCTEFRDEMPHPCLCEPSARTAVEPKSDPPMLPA